MAAKSKIITPEVRKVLGSLEWDGPNAKITCGQLDRKLYQQVNDVLETFGGKWNKKAKAHVFADDASEELDAAVETGVYVSAADIKKVFQEYETPEDLADQLVQRSCLNGKLKVLEPSAGSGNLIRRALRFNKELDIIACEVQPKHEESLRQLCKGCVFIGDFLGYVPEQPGSFDRVIMNPPFTKQQDIDHVLHAYKFLRKGGRLVAIMSPGFTFRDNHKSKAFRELVEENGSYTEIEEGAFKCAGTNVRTVMVTLDK